MKPQDDFVLKKKSLVEQGAKLPIFYDCNKSRGITSKSLRRNFDFLGFTKILIKLF